MPATEQPNILLIMSDEHDPAVLGCYGDQIVDTPHLDGLAARGITFDGCYCNSPLCVPSRLSFTSGQYISRGSAWNNNCWLPSDDYPSLASVLTAAGYDSYLCGKQHYDTTRRYGFTDLLPGIRENDRVKRGRGGRMDPDTVPFNRGAKGWEGRSSAFYEGDRSEVLDNDRLVTERCVEFLAYRSIQNKWHENTRPFFLFAGYLAPHFPMIVPPPYPEKYLGKVPPAEIPEGLLESLPTNYKMLRRGFGVEEADPQVVQRGRDLYWALTEWFDAQVGRVLQALDDSAFADNTVVIYTSDHGENKGDHGMWWKNCMYEHSARVPLLVSWPARWAGGQRRTGACSLVDLVQTLADLGGGEAHEQMDGDSMLPWLDDPDHAWKDFALSEYYGHNVASGFTMLRQGKWKYVYHARINDKYGPERELYDLEADPKEFTNLAGDAAHASRIEQMHAAMVQELGEDPEEIEQRCRAETARGYDRD